MGLVSGLEIDAGAFPQTVGALREDASVTPHAHQLLLGSGSPSVLLYRLLGTLAKCQADASKCITTRHFMT